MQSHHLLAKAYDAETGERGIEITERDDGKFDLTVYDGKNDISVYGITPTELRTIGDRFMAMGASAMNRYLMNAS